MSHAPFIDADDSPDARRVRELSWFALALSVVPWVLCGLNFVALFVGVPPAPRFVLFSWIVGLIVGGGAVRIGTGLGTRMAQVGCALGFTGPIATFLPTVFLNIAGMAGWCC